MIDFAVNHPGVAFQTAGRLPHQKRAVHAPVRDWYRPACHCHCQGSHGLQPCFGLLMLGSYSATKKVLAGSFKNVWSDREVKGLALTNQGPH